MKTKPELKQYVVSITFTIEKVVEDIEAADENAAVEAAMEYLRGSDDMPEYDEYDAQVIIDE